MCIMLHPNKYWTLTSNIIISRNHVHRKKDWINNNCLMCDIKFETTINTRCYILRTHDHDHIADKCSDTQIRYFQQRFQRPIWKKRVKLWFYPFFPVLTAANRHFVPSCRCFTCHSQVAARAQGLPGLPGCDWSSPRRVQQSDVVRTSELPYWYIQVKELIQRGCILTLKINYTGLQYAVWWNKISFSSTLKSWRQADLY